MPNFNYNEWFQDIYVDLNPIQMDDVRQPSVLYEVFSFLLRNVKEVYGCDACVAGGAVRDLFLNFNPKDIDIFLDMQYTTVFDESMRELNWGEGFRTDDRNYLKVDSDIKATYNFYVRGHTVNVILRPIPKENYVKELLDTFDFEICRSAFFLNEEGMLTAYDTEEAIKDRTNKTFTYRKVGNLERSLNRYKKFISRSAEHKKFQFVGPEL